MVSGSSAASSESSTTASQCSATVDGSPTTASKCSTTVDGGSAIVGRALGGARIVNNRDFVTNVVNAADQAKNYANEVIAYKNLILKAPPGTPLPVAPTIPPAIVVPPGGMAGVEAYTRDLVAQLKAHGSYTVAIGQAMGIIGPPDALGTPGVDAQALTASDVRLALFKAGYDLLAVDSRRGGGGWEQIGVSQTAEFIDTRDPLVPGQPETREFRVQGIVNNARTGPMSGISSCVTVP